MAYYIEGLDGTEREVSKSEFYWHVWLYRSIFITFGIVILVMLLGLVIMFLSI